MHVLIDNKTEVFAKAQSELDPELRYEIRMMLFRKYRIELTDGRSVFESW